MESVDLSKKMPFLPKLKRKLFVPVVALLCLVAVGRLQSLRLNKLIDRANIVSPAEINQEVEAEKLRLKLLQTTPSFGFDNIIAVWTWLNFNQYFGDDLARQQTGYSLSPEYFKIIVERDPRFLESYVGLSTSISLFAGKPKESVALMEKGLSLMCMDSGLTLEECEFPTPKIPRRAYYIWRYKAIDELLFLENIKTAQESFARAAQWAGTYSDPESQQVAALSRATAEFLAGNPNRERIRATQASAWASVLVNSLNTNDRRTRDQVIRQIEARGGKVTISPEGGVSVQLP